MPTVSPSACQSPLNVPWHALGGVNLSPYPSSYLPLPYHPPTHLHSLPVSLSSQVKERICVTQVPPRSQATMQSGWSPISGTKAATTTPTVRSRERGARRTSLPASAWPPPPGAAVAPSPHQRAALCTKPRYTIWNAMYLTRLVFATVHLAGEGRYG